MTIYSEKEALTKECRVFGPLNGEIINCVGPDCMHWLKLHMEFDTFWIGNPTMTPERPDGDGWFLTSQDGRPCWRRSMGEFGRCGLINMAGAAAPSAAPPAR